MVCRNPKYWEEGGRIIVIVYYGSVTAGLKNYQKTLHNT